jgi:hypothetical protein
LLTGKKPPIILNCRFSGEPHNIKLIGSFSNKDPSSKSMDITSVGKPVIKIFADKEDKD